MKPGILYPRSNADPGMMADFMDEIKAALKHAELYDHIQLFSESIGFGGNEKEVYEKAEVILLCGNRFALPAMQQLFFFNQLKSGGYSCTLRRDD